MKKLYLLLVSLIFMVPMNAQKTFEVPVWPKGATESNDIADEEKAES